MSPPPLDGNWTCSEVLRTGAWSVGPIWFDLARSRIALHVAERHCNATGVMHGGAMATFLDSQVVALPDEFQVEEHTPTISLTVDFLAPAMVGDWLVVTVEHVKTTKTMIVTQAIARNGERAVARSNAIYSNPTRKDPV